MSEDQQKKLEQDFPEAWAEVQRLTRLVEELQAQLKLSLETNNQQTKMLGELQSKLDELLAQIKKRNKREYGKKTEKHNPRPALTSTISSAQKNDPIEEKATGLKHILDNARHLPGEPKNYFVNATDANCPDCSVETKFVGNQITHQLEMISASLKVIQHIQETRSCPRCKQYIVTAEKPCPPIPGSYVGPRLLSEIIVGKHDYGLPNYRQQRILAHHNITIPRSTQSGWMQATADMLRILFDALKKEVLESAVIKTDDSSIKVQDRKHKNNIRKGKITTYIGDADHPAIVFDYSSDLSFNRNLAFLKNYNGIVQADAAGGFDALFEDGSRTEAGCHAHSRRRYFESMFSEQEVCNRVLNIYRELYSIERKIKDAPAAFKLATRRRLSKPLMKELRKVIVLAKQHLHPTHDLMKAITYTLNHWLALTKFLKNPAIAIDNNEAERAIKTWVLVRKNSLFAGSDAGAAAVAIHLSFIATAKRNGVNPVEWYEDVLARINSLKTSEVHDLLPHRWTKPSAVSPGDAPSERLA